MLSFGVSPPWYRENPIEQMAFNLYAMEQEGYFDEEEDEDDADYNYEP